MHEAVEFKQKYVDEHVQCIQECRQHHVHLPDPKTGERVPLTHCQRKDNPKLCKGNYPKKATPDETKAVVLCKGLLESLGLPSSGKRNQMGSMYGPRVDAYVNGGHPAMLGVQECNSDVQLPYRFPVTAETHCVACPHDCIHTTDESKLIEAAQVAQDAQAGYACDYCTKRQPCAFNEAKECSKGHTNDQSVRETAFV